MGCGGHAGFRAMCHQSGAGAARKEGQSCGTKPIGGETHDISDAERACGRATSALCFGTASHQGGVWKS